MIFAGELTQNIDMSVRYNYNMEDGIEYQKDTLAATHTLKPALPLHD
jgi:hypothetical protein